MMGSYKLYFVIFFAAVFTIYYQLSAKFYFQDIKSVVNSVTLSIIGNITGQCPKGLVVSLISGGRLGNVIWEYMSLYAVSELYDCFHDFTPCVDRAVANELETVFERISIRPVDRLLDKCVNKQNAVKIPINEPIKNNFVGTGYNVLLDMYSSRYEDVIRLGIDKIKQELRFKNELYTDAMRVLNDAKSTFNLTGENVVFIGVHYRGTDYIDHLKTFHGNNFKGPPDYHYYLRAMDIFKKLYDNIIFILITVDDQWLLENRAHLTNESNVIINPNEFDRNKDFTLLSHCNHSIINYGTFGATAALLNKGTTIAYDLKLPLDHRGQTVAMGIAKILPNWFLIN